MPPFRFVNLFWCYRCETYTGRSHGSKPPKRGATRPRRRYKCRTCQREYYEETRRFYAPLRWPADYQANPFGMRPDIFTVYQRDRRGPLKTWTTVRAVLPLVATTLDANHDKHMARRGLWLSD